MGRRSVSNSVRTPRQAGVVAVYNLISFVTTKNPGVLYEKYRDLAGIDSPTPCVVVVVLAPSQRKALLGGVLV